MKGKKSVNNKLLIYGLISYGIAMILNLASAIIATIFIYNEYMYIHQTTLMVFITHSIALFSGISYLLKRVEGRKILCAVLVASGYFITQFLACTLLFGGLSTLTFMLLVPVSIGVIAAIVLDAKPKKHRGRRRK